MVALDQGGHVGPRRYAESLVRLEVGVADRPGEGGVAGDHQVVDGEGDQGAVVGGDTSRAQDLEIFSDYSNVCRTVDGIFGVSDDN